MSHTSVQTAPSSGAVPPVVADTKPTSVTKYQRPIYERILKPLASLRLTVWLFVFALLLVFFGTMAQIDAGIGTVMKQYFRSWFVWVPIKLLVQFGQVFFGVSRDLQVGGSFFFPAGYTVGFALLANLLAAHTVRFKLSWKRSGILILHAGVIILMLGELFTGLFAVEARMAIAKGETVNFTDVQDKVELALITQSKSDPSKDDVVVIPDAKMRKPGVRISNDQLPVDVEVMEFWKNSSLVEVGKKNVDHANAREGLDHRFGMAKMKTFAIAKEGEGSGVESEGRSDLPSARVVFYEKGTDNKIGEMFVSQWYYANSTNRVVEFDPQTIKLNGVTYEVDLRPKREYKNYSIKLKEFSHDVYPGTDTPKNFASLIDLRGEETPRREVKIAMNDPLRYEGETFYQSSFFPGDGGTVLQVVRNPAWLMPYFSCGIVTLGMLVHFGISLGTFLSRTAAQPVSEERKAKS